MRIRFVVVAALLTIGAVSIRPVLAQEPVSEPGSAASQFLFDASSIGEGWRLDQIVSPDLIARYYFEMSPDVFREGAVGVYLGPEGARVVAVALLLAESRGAIPQSWEDATLILAAFRSALEVDYDRELALETMDPPAGCVEAKRTVGITDYFFVPVGVTQCAADPDIIVLAAVLGTVGDASGIAASDRIVQMMVESGQGAGEPSTPTK